MAHTMTPGITLVFLLFGVFVSIVKGQPASQSGATATSTPPTHKSQRYNCTCVPYYLCDSSGKNTTKIRTNNGPCSKFIEFCCKKEDLRKQPITPPPIKTNGCGRRHIDGIDFRITHDRHGSAQYGEFPWMVAVLEVTLIEGYHDKQNLYQCGGALIHPQMVVTAAHCVDGKKDVLKIRAGEWDVRNSDEIYPFQDRDVQTIIVHPEYNARTLYNDIALLYLKSPVDLADNVDTVCLPLQDTVINIATCYATGWGKNVFGEKGMYQVILKKIDLPLIPNNECQNQLRTTTIDKSFELHISFVCAGGEPGKYTCTGDDGGPLVCPIPGQEDRYYQVGIVAWLSRCEESNLPGVFVNVALFRDWIDSQMNSVGLNITSYQYKVSY